ncbi:MAG: hypothetical protein OJF49_002758 [Ktedonobacterales bacterium]|jgi:hypothetical protein|nr:MAG: hypothetical protein OJF49_002758 [Ktedonobacterales bacterium]
MESNEQPPTEIAQHPVVPLAWWERILLVAWVGCFVLFLPLAWIVSFDSKHTGLGFALSLNALIWCCANMLLLAGNAIRRPWTLRSWRIPLSLIVAFLLLPPWAYDSLARLLPNGTLPTLYELAPGLLALQRAVEPYLVLAIGCGSLAFAFIASPPGQRISTGPAHHCPTAAAALTGIASAFARERSMEPEPRNNPPPTAQPNWERRLERVFHGCALMLLVIISLHTFFSPSDSIQSLLFYAAEAVGVVLLSCGISLIVITVRKSKLVRPSWGIRIILFDGIASLPVFGLVIISELGLASKSSPFVIALVVIGLAGAALSCLGTIMFIVKLATGVVRSRRQRAS